MIKVKRLDEFRRAAGSDLITLSEPINAGPTCATLRSWGRLPGESGYEFTRVTDRALRGAMKIWLDRLIEPVRT
jgi:hypothetical protein